MFQIYNAVTETLGRLAHDYGRQAAVVILLLVAITPALRLVGWLLPRGRPPEDGRKP